VQHAHQKGVIHRDLKPSNILIAQYDGRPVPKVIDFGVAKATGPRLTDQTLYTEFGSVVGTLEYMSPEQAELNQLDIDTRSDVYSLGAILYEQLTGSTPLGRERLKGGAFVEMLRIIREEDSQRPSVRLSTTEELPAIAACRQVEPRKLSRLVRGELDWIVMRALEKDRNRRYETANGLASDLQRYLDNEPVQACPPSALYRLRKLARRHKGLLSTAAIVFMALIAGTAVATWQAMRATRAEKETRGALARMTVAQDQTRKALDTLFDDVVEAMFAKQPKLEETEKSFLRRVASLYEEVGRQTAGAAGARILQAEGSFKAAHLRALLGEHSEAVETYRQAEALLRQLAGEFPDVPDYRQRLARLEGNLGILLAEMGKVPEAETAFRSAVTLESKLVADSPANRRYRRDLANGYNDLGVAMQRQIRLAEAEEAFRQALALKEHLASEAGAEPADQLALARSRSSFGSLLRSQGRYAEAEGLYRQALEALQARQRDPAAPPRYRDWLADAHHGLGIVLAELKREAQAETAFRHALEIRKGLTDEFPKVLEYRRVLASAHNDLGFLLHRQGKDADAEGSYRQSLELKKRIAAETGRVPGSLRNLASGYNDLGEVLRDLNRPNEAESAWRDALEIWQQLVAESPGVPEYRCRLAVSLIHLARLHNQRGEFEAGAALLDRAGPHLQDALKARPTYLELRESYRDFLVALAAGRRGLADHAGLATAADELARLAYEPAKDTYAAAGMLARCAALAREGPGLDEAKRKELALGYADRSLALLRRSVERGFKDAAHMKADPDLEPLRERPEFTKLLAGLDAGSAAARKPTP
jgi:tetratricopeptide (TPR) repeat protein